MTVPGREMVLQSVFDVLPAHIALLDERGVIVLINRAWAQYAESNRYCGADFVGLNYLDLCARTEGVDVGDACLAFVEIRSVLAGEQDAFEMVYPCHGPERRRWFKLFVRRHGSGALLMHTDVTAEYAKPAATLPAMLRDMAHEMRTPLNVILGFSDLITREIRGPVAEPYREYGELIQQSGRHLLDLIEAILDISRIEAGALILDEATVDPNGLFRGVIDMMAPLAHAKEIVIEAAFGHLPPVKADEMRLRQVLLNLVGNAIKFTPSGGRVTLGGRITASRAIEVSVSDTGIGIAPEDIDTVLRPFGRAQLASKQKIEGTGLGLPLALLLTELHDGILSLASTPGAGTTVTIQLPAWRTVQAQTEPAPRATTPASA